MQLFASARRIAPESGAEATKLKGVAEQFQETVLGEYRAQLESDSMNENCESADHNEKVGTRTASNAAPRWGCHNEEVGHNEEVDHEHAYHEHTIHTSNTFPEM